MKKLITLLACVALTQLAMAQVSITGSTLSYAQNFDNLDTGFVNSTNLPTGWSVFEYGTSGTVTTPGSYKGSNGSSNSGDAYAFGSTGSNERALGSVASGSNIPSFGVYFVNNTGVAITGFTMKYRVEQWRLGQNRGTVDTTRFLYSTTATGLSDTAATTVWTEDVAGMLNTPNIVDTASGAKNGNAAGYFSNKTVTETLTIPNGGHIVLKWLDKNVVGSDDGLAIDSFSIVFTPASVPPPSLSPIVVSTVPVNGATGVVPGSNLSITFNKPVTKGASGNIYIKNETDQTTTTKAVTSSDVSVSGATATISNAGLVLGKTYHVTFDSIAFDSSVYNSYGIYDTTAWKFSMSSSVVTLDSLMETFDAACALSQLPAGWSKFNVTGAQVWNCTAFGFGSAGMQMNGYASGNNLNEDWLITPKLNLSSFATVALQFVAKKEFAGANLQVLTSTNYSGAGDPNNAVWTNLNVNFTPATVDTQFHAYTSNLTSYKATPMFLGFKYTSTTTDGARWTVDNVYTTRTTGIAIVSNEKLQLMVIGAATTSNITLAYTSAEEGNNQLAIYDITGRMVHTENVHVVSGTQRIALTGLNLHSGMYIVKLSSDRSFGVVKTIVE